MRFLADGRVQLMVADLPSPAAYRMVLRVAEHEWISRPRHGVATTERAQV